MTNAVATLRHLKNRNKRFSRPSIEELLIAVHKAENEGDEIHHRFLAQLFESSFDPFEVIKWKELYKIVEQAIDCCEDAANVVQGIVLKNA